MSTAFTPRSNGHEPSGPDRRQPDWGWFGLPAGSATPWPTPESEGQAEGRGRDPVPEFERGAGEALMDTYNG